MRPTLKIALLIVMATLWPVLPACAQATADDPDMDINYAQPDFTLSSLPTTLRVPRHKSAFRVTHRFTRALGEGDFGDLLGDFFGLDTGAQIGLEYRFGLFRGTQVGIHRTSDRTIEFFGEHEVLAQSESFPLTVSAFASIDGTENFKDSYTPVVGAVLSRTLGEHGAVYLEPFYVNNANLLPSEVVDHNDSFLLGLGARVRVRPTVYVVLEGAPRLAGYDEDSAQMSFGLEKRSGGHVFQLTFSNGFGTTMGQVARGARNTDDWHIGFNISRKFY
jgi:hypothetical protein